MSMKIAQYMNITDEVDEPTRLVLQTNFFQNFIRARTVPGYKRFGPGVMRVGKLGDDFFTNTFTVVLEQKIVRVPRILTTHKYLHDRERRTYTLRNKAKHYDKRTIPTPVGK